MKPTPIIKTILIIIIIGIFYACPTPCDTINTIEISPISDTILSSIPYKTGDEIVFIHSGGAKIIFTIVRENTTELNYCDHCCDIWEYKMDKTVLSPNYSINPIEITLTKSDEEYIDFWMSFGRSNFHIVSYNFNTDFIDSLLVNSELYFDVLCLKAEENQYYIDDGFSLFADSVYYNYKYGIIKIVMSNNEYYLLNDE